MDSIFIFKMHMNWTEKYISIINQRYTVTNSVGTSTSRRNRFLHLGLHHFNPPSLHLSATSSQSKGNLGEHYVLQGTKGCKLKYKQS